MLIYNCMPFFADLMDLELTVKVAEGVIGISVVNIANAGDEVDVVGAN